MRLSVIIPSVLALMVLLCGGPMLALLLPAVQAAREAARRIHCANNLANISLAMVNYQTRYGAFPPAYIPDKNGKPMHSWRVLLLPDLERSDLYNAYRFDEPWDSPNNRKVSQTVIRLFQCPSARHAADDCTTDYMMVVGPHTITDGAHGKKLSQITDGVSHTIMLVEVANSGVNWAEPKDLQFDQLDFKIKNDSQSLCIGSHHPSGCNVTFCDGHICFLTNSTTPEQLKALLTADSGDKIPDWPDDD
jgi:prepilin-type processing-associated H-X9-DG protein